jgi:hypothetical protein
VYHWLHIPSGTTGVRTVEADHLSREMMLEELNRWNSPTASAGRQLWKYWMGP